MKSSRHPAVCLAAVLVAACIVSIEAAPRSGPGWRMIFNNDATNILNCVSSYNPNGDRNTDGLTDAKIRASVAEAAVAGVDAQLIQPGMGWVPWWKSEIAPLEAQEAWFREHYGLEPANAYHKYLLAGGDMIGVFIDECKKHRVAALASFRLNDAHHLEYAYATYAEGLRGAMVQSLAKFYVEHPEYRLNPDIRDVAGSTNNNVKLHNWLIPEVRQYKLDLIAEMLGRYDFDGLELDFMRYQIYFPTASTDEERAERVVIMSAFIGKVRAILDATAKPGQHKWLGAQMPADQAEWNDVGFDPVEWRRQGIEWFNMKPSAARTSQQTALAALRAAVPDATIYYTLFQQSQVWNFTGVTGYGNSCFRRTTKEMLENTSRIALARGADGLSFFNFVYYRKHGSFSERVGPFNEPPFELIPGLLDRAALEQPPGYFFLEVGGLLFTDGAGASNNSREFQLDILPRKRNTAGTLRLQLITNDEWTGDETTPPSNVSRGEWLVTLNGVQLAPAVRLDAAYPFETPIKAGFGHASQYLSWNVPAGLLRDGANTLFVRALDLPDGLPSNGLRLKWVEITQPLSPILAAIPEIVAAGGEATIAGDDLTDVAQVYFADVPAAAFRVDSSAQITATAPPFLASGGKITLRMKDGSELRSDAAFALAVPPG
ncbi:IPT/TIG domain-containing protein, partial [Termitidicoccus mucosus]|uniref:IPT/TIG domain-containing protein n=2 Tax=Termitidicoccus mucosus TaxID=1184151 RepID=UPI002FEE35F9